MHIRKVTERRERNTLHLKSETNKNIINISYERTAVNLSISISSVTQIRTHHRSRNGARLCTTNSSVSHGVVTFYPPRATPYRLSSFRISSRSRGSAGEKDHGGSSGAAGNFLDRTVSQGGKLCEFISNRNRTAMSYRPCERQVVRRNNIYVDVSGKRTVAI